MPPRKSPRQRYDDIGFTRATVPQGEAALTGGRTAGPVDPYAGIKQFFNPFGTPQPGDQTIGSFLAGPLGTQMANAAPGQMTPGAPDAEGGAGDGGDEDAFKDEWLRLLAELEKPLDMNDPLVQNILTGARTATLSDLAGRGIHGGYSEANAQQAYINSAAQLQNQKRDAYLRALGAAGDYEQRGKAARLEQDRYLSENDPARGIGGLIGGGLGGLAGGLGGFALGGPAGAFEGARLGVQSGSQIGAGIGGFFAPQPRMRGWGGSGRRTAGGY